MISPLVLAFRFQRSLPIYSLIVAGSKQIRSIAKSSSHTKMIKWGLQCML